MFFCINNAIVSDYFMTCYEAFCETTSSDMLALDNKV